jgi:hypothetical protein
MTQPRALAVLDKKAPVATRSEFIVNLEVHVNIVLDGFRSYENDS